MTTTMMTTTTRITIGTIMTMTVFDTDQKGAGAKVVACCLSVSCHSASIPNNHNKNNNNNDNKNDSNNDKDNNKDQDNCHVAARVTRR